MQTDRPNCPAGCDNLPVLATWWIAIETHTPSGPTDTCTPPRTTTPASPAPRSCRGAQGLRTRDRKSLAAAHHAQLAAVASPRPHLDPNPGQKRKVPRLIYVGTSKVPLRAPMRNADHSGPENESTGPDGSFELRTSTTTSPNATSTQLPSADVSLFRQTISVRSKPATRPPSVEGMNP